MIHGLDGFDPLGLLHAVSVGNVDAQRKAVIDVQWHAIPLIGQHHPWFGPDDLEREDLIESVCRADLQVGRSGLQVQVRQESLQADSRPARRAGQVARNGVGDARERDELVQRLISPERLQANSMGFSTSPSTFSRHWSSRIIGGAVLMSMR